MDQVLRERRMRAFRVFEEFNREQSGQDLLEYALVLATVLTAIVVGSNSLATVIASALGTIESRMTTLVS